MFLMQEIMMKTSPISNNTMQIIYTNMFCYFVFYTQQLQLTNN